MRILNLGILAHVDAGKTSLTERLLHAAGVIDTIGSVDDGTSQTDSLPLERQRGITIKSAVVSFVIGEVTVNLIDTPGHPERGPAGEKIAYVRMFSGTVRTRDRLHFGRDHEGKVTAISVFDHRSAVSCLPRSSRSGRIVRSNWSGLSGRTTRSIGLATTWSCSSPGGIGPAGHWRRNASGCRGSRRSCRLPSLSHWQRGWPQRAIPWHGLSFCRLPRCQTGRSADDTQRVPAASMSSSSWIAEPGTHWVSTGPMSSRLSALLLPTVARARTPSNFRGPDRSPGAR
jgi:hypothetical protein